jgi:murein hydrolase activator
MQQDHPSLTQRRLHLVGRLTLAAVVVATSGSLGAQNAQSPALSGLPPEQAAEALRRHRDLSVRIAGLQQEADALARRSGSLLRELRQLEVERDLQRARAEQAQASLDVIVRDLEELEQRLDVLRTRHANETPAVVARLQRLQRMGRVGYARIAWGTSSASGLGRAARFMTRLAREDAERIAEYRLTTAALETTEARLQERRAQAVDLRVAASAQLRAADVAAAERRTLIASIASQRERQVQMAEELERARRTLDGTVAALRPVPPAARPDTPMPALRQSLPWPTTGSVARRFGRTRDARFGTVVVHNGIDIATSAGAPVRSVHAGTVAFADTFDAVGRLVIVDHGREAYSLYGYLATVGVRRGDTVEAGDVVGTVGEAPAGSPALYFELRVDGTPVDPLQWLLRR